MDLVGRKIDKLMPLDQSFIFNAECKLLSLSLLKKFRLRMKKKFFNSTNYLSLDMYELVVNWYTLLCEIPVGLVQKPLNSF